MPGTGCARAHRRQEVEREPLRGRRLVHMPSGVVEHQPDPFPLAHALLLGKGMDEQPEGLRAHLRDQPEGGLSGLGANERGHVEPLVAGADHGPGPLALGRPDTP